MNQTQIQRISIIDRVIRKGKPNQKDLKAAIEEEIGINISISNIDKDLNRMRLVFNSPVSYIATTHNSGYYTYTKPYDFGIEFIRYWADFVEFNKDINKIVML